MTVAAALDAEQNVKTFKESKKIDIPILADSKAVDAAWGAKAPVAFLLGKDGKVLWKGKAFDAAFTKTMEDALAAK